MCQKHKVEQQERWVLEQKKKMQHWNNARQTKKKTDTASRAHDLKRELDVSGWETKETKEEGDSGKEHSNCLCVHDWNPDAPTPFPLLHQTVSLALDNPNDIACMDTRANTSASVAPSTSNVLGSQALPV